MWKRHHFDPRGSLALSKAQQLWLPSRTSTVAMAQWLRLRSCLCRPLMSTGIENSIPARCPLSREVVPLTITAVAKQCYEEKAHDFQIRGETAGRPTKPVVPELSTCQPQKLDASSCWAALSTCGFIYTSIRWSGHLAAITLRRRAFCTASAQGRPSRLPCMPRISRTA